MEWPDHGAEKFVGPLGARAYSFEHWLQDNLHAFPIQSIAIEAPVPVRGKTSLDTLAWLLGAHVIVRKLAHDYDLDLAIIGVGTWRSFFIGHANAPRIIPQKERRKWLKSNVIAECQNRGIEPKDDNAADALGLLFYCLSCADNKILDDLFLEAA
jgi:hypothetical protein